MECECGKAFVQENGINGEYIEQVGSGNHGRVDDYSGAGDYDNKIIGGDEAVPNAFPWIVRIIGGCAKGEQIWVGHW